MCYGVSGAWQEVEIDTIGSFQKLWLSSARLIAKPLVVMLLLGDDDTDTAESDDGKLKCNCIQMYCS